jgi:putative ABC transport system permease protein
MVTEPYAFRHGIEPGDTLTLPTPAGPQRFVVGAVYRDYASDRGNVALSRAAWDRLWPGTPHYTGIGLYTGPGFDPGPLRRLLAADEDALGPGPELQSGAAIRAASLAVFDRTFTITEVLRLLAGAIACVGVLGALLAIELERAREMAVLKALGYTGAQIRRLVLTETGLMGAIAGLLALPVGVAMAAALVFVINRRAFGWTMPLHLDPAQLLLCPLLAVLAALLAGIGPARRIARAEPARLLSSE